MRPLATLAIALSTVGSAFALSQPATAFGDDTHGYGTVYIHHHVYYPPRYKHIYHMHKPGPRHVHLVHHTGYPWAWRGDSYRLHYGPLGGYFAPRYKYRRAQWRHHYR